MENFRDSTDLAMISAVGVSRIGYQNAEPVVDLVAHGRYLRGGMVACRATESFVGFMSGDWSRSAGLYQELGPS